MVTIIMTNNSARIICIIILWDMTAFENDVNCIYNYLKTNV